MMLGIDITGRFLLADSVDPAFAQELVDIKQALDGIHATVPAAAKNPVQFVVSESMPMPDKFSGTKTSYAVKEGMVFD